MKKQKNYYATKVIPSIPNYKCASTHFTDLKKAKKHISKGGIIERELKDGTRKLHLEVIVLDTLES